MWSRRKLRASLGHSEILRALSLSLNQRSGLLMHSNEDLRPLPSLRTMPQPRGDLHWKVVSVYINRMGQVMVKMKSKHVAGTITKKKKSVVVDVCKNIPAWAGRHLLEGGEQRRYFGLRTREGRVVEFECRSQREYKPRAQSGLYRYRFQCNVVKPAGFYNSTAELKFVCRRSLLLTINIDKNTEKDLQLTVEEAANSWRLKSSKLWTSLAT
ncbi:GH3 family protein [Dioscorea alata]|uniref:GH3 family protein n=1 Tax=Dioscorea alata TaxID=55571 RepID=A0ACB7VE02_DIOAL|nr:GH3 family protein [Dioscorea alata]